MIREAGELGLAVFLTKRKNVQLERIPLHVIMNMDASLIGLSEGKLRPIMDACESAWDAFRVTNIAFFWTR